MTTVDEGLLWFDDRQNIPLATKIAAAVDFFEEKYGRKPQCCYVNPCNSLEGLPLQELGLRVEVSSYILPNHYLLEQN